MLKSYFKIAYRNLLRNRSFSIINILGLAGGMAVCMFIIAVIADQNNFDTFHEKGSRIFRVLSDDTNSDAWATAPILLKEELKTSFSGIETVVAIRRQERFDLKIGEKGLPFAGFFTTSDFFTLFDFELTNGQESTTLTNPYSIVLSEATATKLNVKSSHIGQVISVNDWGDFTLTGIVEKPIGKTHLKFDCLISEATIKPLRLAEKINPAPDAWSDTWNTYVYFLLQENANSNEIAQEFPAITKRLYAEAERKIDFILQPLSDVSPSKILNNEMNMTMPILMLQSLAMLAFMVLITACFNYTNLSVAKSLTRAKEIGIRKVIGARRIAIMIQFIAEAVLTALLALILAVLLLELVILPQFTNLYFTNFFEFDAGISLNTYLIFIGFSILVGLLAGLVPAFYLSALKPVKVLKTITNLKVFKQVGIRKVLMVSQLIIAMVFFATVVILFQQTSLLLKAEYGFEKENLLNISLQGNDFQQVKTLMAENKNVLRTSGTSIIPGIGEFEHVNLLLPDSTQAVRTSQFEIDEDFIKNLDLKILAGQGFLKDDITGNSRIILNERSVKKMGFATPEEAIGQMVVLQNQSAKTQKSPAQVVGVVKDFVDQFIGTRPAPVTLIYDPKKVSTVNLKIAAENIPATLAFAKEQWSKIDPIHPMEFRFLDDQLYLQVSLFEDAVKIIGFLSFLAILITCMGLLGIANYSVQTRQKEIGIRKVLGADLQNILWTLSKSMIFPILIAIAISTPIIWFLNTLWLAKFAYPISLNISNMGMSIFILSALALVIVLSQAYRVANENPVKVLRTE
jgi:putative ABC transport system permease protein